MPWNERLRRRIKLRDLDILMAVIAAGGMGKAVGRLNMSQSAISKAVADLEHTLGVRLLDRSRKGVEPTPYGHVLVQRGAIVFDELRQSVADINFLSDPTAGELRIGTTEPLAAAIISPVIDRLVRQHPLMSFHVITGDTGTLYQQLAARNVDFMLARISREVAEEHSSDTLFRSASVIVAGARNPLTRRRKIALSDLMNEPWVLGPLDSNFGMFQADVFRACGLAPPRLTVSSVSTNLRNELLSNGRFLSVLPGFSLRLPRRHPWLRALPVELPDTRMPVAIVTLKNRSPSPLARLFIERVHAFTKPLAQDR